MGLLRNLRKAIGIKVGCCIFKKDVKPIEPDPCSHCGCILAKLRKGERLTSQSYSEKYKSTKLTSRISELRCIYKQPVKSYWENVNGKKSHKVYYM